MMMVRPANTLLIVPPEPGLELHLARRIHAARSRLEEEILDQLAGRPRRYADLQPWLRGRNTNVLNKALRSLSNEGLIDQYGDPEEPRSSKYQMTSLGTAVLYALIELRFAERVHTMLPTDARAAPA